MIGILIVLFGVMIHAPLSVGLGQLWPQQALLFKAWKEVLLGVLLIIGLMLISQRKLWPQLAHDRLIQLTAAYGLLHLILIPLSNQGWPSIIAGLLIDMRFVLFFVLCYMAVKLEPRAMSRMIKVFLVGAGIVVGFGLLQITILPDDILRTIGYSKATIAPYGTIDKNPDFVRINSTLRGPNPLGAFCVIVISLLGAYFAAMRRKLSYRQKTTIIAAAAMSAAVLFASYSRSAYLALVVAFGLLAASIVTIRWSRRVVLGGLIAAYIAIVGVMGLQSSDWYQNVVLHEDPQSSVVKKSNSEHVRSLEVSTARAVQQPLGGGIGSTGSASLYDTTQSGTVVENYYLFVMHETGWLGGGMFVAIVMMTQWRLWQRRSHWMALGLFASGMGLAVIALLLPVWADDTIALVWWGLAGAIIGSSYEKRTSK